MRIVGVLCLVVALVLTVSGTAGLWTLSRPRAAPRIAGPTQLALRAQQVVAPAQLAAAALLAVAGAVALAAPPRGAVLVAVCVVGAVGTVLAGSWQGARYALRVLAELDRPAPAGCGGDCSCAQSSTVPLNWPTVPPRGAEAGGP